MREANLGKCNLELQLEEPPVEWLKESYVGRIRDMDKLQVLQENFLMGSYLIQARHLGNNLVLLKGGNEVALDEFLKDENEWLNEVFENIERWNLNIVPQFRQAWIRCEGTPWLVFSKLCLRHSIGR